MKILFPSKVFLGTFTVIRNVYNMVNHRDLGCKSSSQRIAYMIVDFDFFYFFFCHLILWYPICDDCFCT